MQVPPAPPQFLLRCTPTLTLLVAPVALFDPLNCTHDPTFSLPSWLLKHPLFCFLDCDKQPQSGTYILQMFSLLCPTFSRVCACWACCCFLSASCARRSPLASILGGGIAAFSLGKLFLPPAVTEHMTTISMKHNCFGRKDIVFKIRHESGILVVGPCKQKGTCCNARSEQPLSSYSSHSMHENTRKS